ncbi:unnamed protein product, partial [Iphiclides podalirius]
MVNFEFGTVQSGAAALFGCSGQNGCARAEAGGEATAQASCVCRSLVQATGAVPSPSRRGLPVSQRNLSGLLAECLVAWQLTEKKRLPQSLKIYLGDANKNPSIILSF